jgi:hypothetical protein
MTVLPFALCAAPGSPRTVASMATYAAHKNGIGNILGALPSARRRTYF